MSKSQHDWDHWYQVFVEFQKRAGKKPLSLFCRKHGLPYQNAKKAFAARRKKNGNGKFFTKASGDKNGGCKSKHNWAALHADWLAGDYVSLSEFARLKGLNRKSGHFQERTKSWVAEKGEIQAKAEARALGGVENLTVAKAEAEILSQLDTVMALLSDACSKGYAVGQKVVYPLDWKFFVSTIRDLIRAQKEFLPFFTKLVNKRESIAILEQVKTGDMSVHEACFRYEILGISLPKTLEIELKRAEEPEDDTMDLISDEELERRYQEGLQRIEKQKREFLPERRRSIEELKREMESRDSFVNCEKVAD